MLKMLQRVTSVVDQPLNIYMVSVLDLKQYIVSMECSMLFYTNAV